METTATTDDVRVVPTDLGSSDMKRKVLRGGLVTTGGQAAKVLLRIVSLGVLARLLDPKDFGLVGMVTAITGVFEIVKDAGLSTVTVQRPSITEQQISTLFWLNMAVGALLAAVSLALAPGLVTFYREPRLFWVTVAMAPGFLLNAAGVQHSALLQRGMRFVAITVVDVVSLAVGAAVGIAMALSGLGYWALVGMTVVQTAVSSLAVWVATGWIPGMPARNAGTRSMLRFGGTVTLNSMVVYVAYNLEKVLLGRFWGAEALGLYGRAYQLISLPTQLLNSSVGSVAFPALSRLQGEPERFKSYFLKGYSLVVALTLPTTLACALFADDIIAVLLGPKWKEAAAIFRLLAPTILVLALINPLAWLMFAMGRVGRSLQVSLVLGPVVVMAYVIGLPHGPTGVAFAYSTAMVLWLVPHVIWCTHGTNISLRDIAKAAGPFMISAFAAALIAFGVQEATRQLESPFVRLAICGGTLVIAYLWMLLRVMGQTAFYLDLFRGATGRAEPVPVKS